MKTNDEIYIATMVFLWLLVCMACYADCPKGSTEYQKDVCTVDIRPSETAPDGSTQWVSEDKPPRNPQPPWQTGEVKDLPLKDVVESTGTAPIDPAEQTEGKAP